MKNLLRTLSVVSLLMLLLPSCVEMGDKESRIDHILSELHNPNSDNVLVAAHRGDWRNFPENSIEAIESVIEMGADIVELDIDMTSDSVLILCHDRTLNRTTNLKGRTSEIPYHGVIDGGKLKTGHGIVTNYHIPTLEEALMVCKDRIVINIDKGYDFYDQVMALLERTGTAGQVLIKGSKPKDVVARKMADYKENMLYMPIIGLGKESGVRLLESYLDGPAPLAYELVWNEENDDLMKQACERIRKQGARIWTNSLWDSLCGGYDDDDAIKNPGEIYGKHISYGATIIQTDRPALLIDWLRSKGLHD